MIMSMHATLLVVADQAAHMHALCQTLEQEGYVTNGFTSAKEALAALGHGKFELILTDLMMPEMDGIAFLRAAQQIDPRIVGVVMTGHGTIDTAVAAMKAGALDYILKPFNLSVILPVLSRALNVYRLRVENAELQCRLQDRMLQLEASNEQLAVANMQLMKNMGERMALEQRFRDSFDHASVGIMHSARPQGPDGESQVLRDGRLHRRGTAAWVGAPHPSSRGYRRRSAPREAVGGWRDR
jgi:DNA-binding NtrC family response regulator